MNQWTWYNIIIMSQSYKVITSCQTSSNIQAIIIHMKKKHHTNLSKWKINQWTRYNIIIMSQSYKVITSCQTATNIPATISQMKNNTI